MKRLQAKFFRAESGTEPVKDWLKNLSREDCRIIGSDIKDVEFSFPIGLPLCRQLSGYKDLWEVRIDTPHAFRHEDSWFNESTYHKIIAYFMPEMVLSPSFYSITEVCFGMPYRTVQNLKSWLIWYLLHEHFT